MRRARGSLAVVHHACAATCFRSRTRSATSSAPATSRRRPDQSASAYGHGYVNGTKWRDIMSTTPAAGLSAHPRLVEPDHPDQRRGRRHSRTRQRPSDLRAVRESCGVPLSAAIGEMERRWRESGIPGFYVGRNGPVSRERARNVRAFAGPKPKLPTGKLERFSIPPTNGPIAVEAIQPVEGTPMRNA